MYLQVDAPSYITWSNDVDNAYHMREFGFSLTCIFPYKDRIYDIQSKLNKNK